MTVEELLEEIRQRLREPQEETVSTPYLYSDDDLYFAIRSALRNLDALGVEIEATFTLDGDLVGELTTRQGILVSLWVAANLLRSDLTQKVRDGEMGVFWKEEQSVIDDRQAAAAFISAAKDLEDELRTLLTIALSTTTLDLLFGGPNLSI